MTLDNIIQIAREVGFAIKVEDVDKFERFAALVAAATLEEKPIAWMQRLQPEPPVAAHNRITSVEEVAKEWDNPIPLYARKGASNG